MTNLIFLFVFLPLAVLGYYVVDNRLKQFMLLLFSLIFYACITPEYFFLLIFVMLVNIVLGNIIHADILNGKPCKRFLVCGILFNLLILGYYKYFDFLLLNSNRLFHTSFRLNQYVLPLGLSFFSFKAISFLVDTYRNKIEKYSPLTAALYLSFFGQISSGPITRYQSFETIPSDRELLSSGVVRFMLGFSKKILLANTLNNIVVEIFDRTPELSTSLAWLGAICFSLQIYFDFSGYSDMAIGISNIFGYPCMENFDFPYMTKSVSEFWRRWHISLSSWFRDYIYIPLGGSKKGPFRLVVSLLTVWLLTGLWHGASWNFVLWGMVFFAAILFEKLAHIEKITKNPIAGFAYRLLVLLFLVFQWVLFRSEGLSRALTHLKAMLIPQQTISGNARAAFLLQDYAVFIALAFILSTPILRIIRNICMQKVWLKRIYEITSALVIIFLFLCALSFVISGLNNPFLYANF